MDLGGILLARHGETDDNLEPFRFQGFTDTPLNDTGRRQAHELAERVAGDGIRSLWSSDLSRARETAGIVGARIGLEPTLDERLREGYRGRWEGHLMRDIQRQEPERRNQHQQPQPRELDERQHDLLLVGVARERAAHGSWALHRVGQRPSARVSVAACSPGGTVVISFLYRR